jgi:exodeoxyribonuclease VII small subunit
MSAQPHNANESPSFSTSIEALESVLQKLKSNTPLEEALQLFESGVGHLTNCRTQLASTRGKVEILVNSLSTDADVVAFESEA